MKHNRQKCCGDKMTSKLRRVEVIGCELCFKLLLSLFEDLGLGFLEGVEEGSRHRGIVQT